MQVLHSILTLFLCTHENAGVCTVGEAVVDAVAKAESSDKDIEVQDEPDTTWLDTLSCGPAEMFLY